MDPLATFIVIFVLSMIGISFIAPKLQAYLHLRKYKNNLDNVDEESEFCALCSKHKSGVEKLIAGNKGAVCSGCLLDSIFLLDSEKDGILDKLKYLDKLIIRKLDERDLSDELDKHLAQYVLEKCKISVTQKDLILGEFLSRKNFEYTKMIISDIPQEEWRYFEALNWIWCNSMEGDFEKALDLPRIKKSDDTLENEIYERHLALNKISVKIELDKTEENVKSRLQELLDLNDILKGIITRSRPITERLCRVSLAILLSVTIF